MSFSAIPLSLNSTTVNLKDCIDILLQ
uniref:Uncharacterized protein n=1 Tax=Anguilla anguilla TaxID=7936 RepID=A0A0E9Q417_ANGAN